MSDKDSTKTKVNKEASKNAVIKLEARRAVKQLSGNAEWDLVQETLQEIIASHTIANPEVLPRVPQLIRELELEIKKRYKLEEELQKLLLESIPKVASIRAWMKKDGWGEAIWKKIQETGLFTHENRMEMINALHKRGVERDTSAAKIWLTLSGDYTDKVDFTDGTLEKFREINKVLHGKDEDE